MSEGKKRLGNILVATTLVLYLAVWIPTFAVGALGIEAFHGWTSDWLETAYAYTSDVGRKVRWRQGFREDTVLIWACITGAVLAAQYFVTGSVMPIFKK